MEKELAVRPRRPPSRLKLWVAVVLIFVVVLTAVLLRSVAPLPKRTVTIGGHQFTVEVAATTASRERGLSGRERLAADAGMLFIFPSAAAYGFWMRGMSFPLDIIWVRDGVVVDIAPGVMPAVAGVEAPRYTPRLPADSVLEVPAGSAAAAALKIGDRVRGL